VEPSSRNPAGHNNTRLIVRWRGDYSPGLGNALSLGIPTKMGALIMRLLNWSLLPYRCAQDRQSLRSFAMTVWE